jgi:hypothetical protein
MRMSDRLDRVFGGSGGGGSTGNRINGRIVGREGNGVYTVETDSGAKLPAEADGEYAQGTRVAVWQGRILGRTGGRSGGRVFDV